MVDKGAHLFLNQGVGGPLPSHMYVLVVLGICKEALSDASGQDIYLFSSLKCLLWAPVLEKLAWLQPHRETSQHSPGLADVLSCFPCGKLCNFRALGF